MSVFRVWLVILLSVAVALGVTLFGNEQSAEEVQNGGYSGVKLFAIPYGSEASQVGFAIGAGPEGFQVAGPSHIKVDRYGNVWLLSGSQVKAFRRDGTLLRMVGRVTRNDPDRAEDERSPLEHLQFIRTYAIDGRGYVYFTGDRPLTHLFVINGSNELVLSDRDVYGNLMQVRGEEKMLWQLQRQFGHELAQTCLRGLGGPLFMCTDERDYLYLLADAPVQDKERGGRETCFYEFTPDLEFVGTVPGYYMGPDGYTYEFAADNTAENIRLHTYDREGNRVRTTQLIRPEGPWPSCDTPVFDRSHNIYLPCPRKRTLPMTVMPGVEISHDLIVYKYSPDGELLAEFTIPYPPVDPTGAPSPIAVDKEENMYYLNFGASELQVMIVGTKKYPTSTTTP